jgi:hypothetical protein
VDTLASDDGLSFVHISPSSVHVAGSPFIFVDHRCTKLEIDFDAKARHDAGLDIFQGKGAQSFSRWADDLKIGSHMKPGENFEVVKELRSLLVIQTH